MYHCCNVMFQVNGEDSDGNTALHHASNSGCVDSVAVLPGAGACINALNAYGESSLHLAAAQGHLLVIHRLLLGGALCIFALSDTTAQWYSIIDLMFSAPVIVYML